MTCAWQISVIGAFDRFNYGDILFARVAEMHLERHFPGIQPEFYALRDSDLSEEGGVPTKALSDLYQRELPSGTQHLVVLSGGELLSPGWTQMAEHLVSPERSLKMKKLHKRTGTALWDPLWQRRYKCPNRLPWTINPLDFKDPERTHVVYNAVGGASLAQLTRLQRYRQAKVLRRADWLSVRDEPSAVRVVARGLPRPPVVPDSAVTMAALLSDTEAATWRSKILSEAGLTEAPYLCIQSGERWVRGHEDELAAQLRRLHDEMGIQILSFAIGRAAGHDDQVTSQRLEDRLGHEPWFGVAPETLPVKGVMALIAGSQGYMGTSLHGYITAFSFGRPHVGILPAIVKILGFRDAWDLPEMPAGVLYPDLAQAMLEAQKIDPKAIQAQTRKIAGLYTDSFAEMVDVLGKD